MGGEPLMWWVNVALGGFTLLIAVSAYVVARLEMREVNRER